MSYLATLATTIGYSFPAVTDADIEKLFAEAVALASAADWLGTDAGAMVERLAHECLWPPQDGGPSSSGEEK